jgi:hypothetical protein
VSTTVHYGMNASLLRAWMDVLQPYASVSADLEIDIYYLQGDDRMDPVPGPGARPPTPPNDWWPLLAAFRQQRPPPPRPLASRAAAHVELFAAWDARTQCYRIPMLVALPWGVLLAFAEARGWEGDGCHASAPARRRPLRCRTPRS